MPAPARAPQTEPLHITSPEAAELLARPEIARLLKPFMRGPKTVSEVAQAQGVSVESLHYRVQQLYRAGLLRVTGEIPRRGRPLKLYEAVAADFTFPASLVRPETLRDLTFAELWLREFLENLERHGSPGLAQVLRVTLNEHGALDWTTREKEAQQDAAHPATFFMNSGALYLTLPDAQALADDLRAVYLKYEGRGGPKRYGLILGLTPMTRPVD